MILNKNRSQMNMKPIVVFIAVVLIAVSVATAQDTISSVDPPTILSDTHGYDLSRYMGELIKRVRINWNSVIPELARRGEKGGRVVIIFTIVQDGKVQDLRLVVSSNVAALDRAAAAAIRLSEPFSPLPSDFKGDRLLLEFPFRYNIESEKH